MLLYAGGHPTDACRKMEQIIHEMQSEYSGSLKIESINAIERQDLVNAYNIKNIPTQVFIGINGKELFRHEGVLSKDDILAKWKELGVTVTKGPILNP